MSKRDVNRIQFLIIGHANPEIWGSFDGKSWTEFGHKNRLLFILYGGKKCPQ